MSNHVISLVSSRNLGVGFSAKAILLYMADKSSDDGSGVWVSKGRIARELETTDRTVQRKIEELTGLGFVEQVGKRQHRNGYTFDYTIDVERVAGMPLCADQPPTHRHPSPQDVGSETQDIAGDTLSPPTHRHPTPDTVSPVPPTQCHPNPNTTIQEPLSVAAPQNLEDLFEDFLSAHPRPKNEVETEDAFRRLVRDGTDPHDLIRAAKVYADQQKGNSYRFISGSDTWLQRGGHVDALRPAPPAPDQASINASIADRIKTGRAFLVTNVTDAKAVELIGLGLVTAAECQAVGLSP